MESPSGINYGEEQGPWMSAIIMATHGTVRKLIRGGCKEFAKFTKFEIGNGVWVQFWHNARYADEPLKILCPELFQIGLLKE